MADEWSTRFWPKTATATSSGRPQAGPLLSSVEKVLAASSRLGDIGYAPKLTISGFHPLDEARQVRPLASRGWSLITPRRGTRRLKRALAEFDDEDSLA